MKKNNIALPLAALLLALATSAFTSNEKLQDQAWFPRLSDGSYSDQPMDLASIPCVQSTEICAGLFNLDANGQKTTTEPIDTKPGTYVGQ